MRFLSLLLTIAFAHALGAATQYRYVRTSTGDPLAPKRSATIRVEGNAYRIDWDHVVRASSAFSTDGGKTVLSLNRELSTWFRANAEGPASETKRDSTLYAMPIINLFKAKVELKRIALTEEPGSEIAGHATKKYVLRFAYDVKLDVHGNPLRGIFHSSVTLWMADTLDATVLPIDPRRVATGHEPVDVAVTNALAKVKGFPLRRELIVTRQLEGGPVLSDVVTTTFDEFTTAELPATDLVVPEGYRHQEPIIGMPGL